MSAASVLPREPEELCDGIAQRTQQSQPLVERAHARLVRLIEPEVVIRQIEFAGAAGNRGAVLDGAQELRVPQRLQKRRAGAHEIRAQTLEVRREGLQPLRVDARICVKLAQVRELALELLERVRADITAHRDREDVDQAGESGTTSPLARGLVVVERLVVEKIQA